MIRVAHMVTDPRAWPLFFAGQPEYLRERHMEFHAISLPGPPLEKFAQNTNSVPHPVEISRSISPARDVVTVWQLWKLFRKIRPHAVTTHYTKPALVGLTAALAARVPVRVYHNHGMALCSASGMLRLLLGAAERIACAMATKVVYVSPSVRDVALEKGICARDKTGVILSINGIDAAQRFNPHLYWNCGAAQRLSLGIPEDAMVLGFAGRIFWVKGIFELVKAWDRLKYLYPTLHLLIAGETDERLPLPPEIKKQLTSDPRIHLAGYVDDMRPLYAAMDIFTLPSHHEGLGYVVLEASAMELPIVATRIPGTVDAVLNEVTGLLIRPGDPDGIVRAVSRYLDSPDLRRKHGKAGREYVLETFPRERVWEDTYRLYAELLESKGIRLAAATQDGVEMALAKGAR